MSKKVKEAAVPVSWLRDLADALFAAGVVRDEATVKAEALREAAILIPRNGLGGRVAQLWLRERADEMEGGR